MYIDDSTRVKHTLDASRQALKFISERNRPDLDSDQMLTFALVRAIEITGEAARLVSDEFKSNHPEISWIDIIGMRNRVIHEYFDIDLNVVWDTVISDIPSLIEQLEAII